MPFSIWKAVFKDFFVLSDFKSEQPKVPTMKGNVSVVHLVGKECKMRKIELSSWAIFRNKLFFFF